MLVTEAAAYYRKQGKTLWDVLQEIYAKYGYTCEEGVNIILEGIPGKERIDRMMKWIRNEKPMQIGAYKIDHIIDYIDGYEDLPPHNALRFFVDEDTWFAVRPSGTEPKIKMYFYSSDETMQKAKEKNEAIKKAVLDLINAVE